MSSFITLQYLWFSPEKKKYVYGLGQGCTRPAGRAPGRPSPRAAGRRAGLTWSSAQGSGTNLTHTEGFNRIISLFFFSLKKTLNCYLTSHCSCGWLFWLDSWSKKSPVWKGDFFDRASWFFIVFSKWDIGNTSFCVVSPKQANSHSSDASYHGEQEYNEQLRQKVSWYLREMHCRGLHLFWHGCNNFIFKGRTDFSR